MTTLPAAWAAIETALHQRQPIQISYHGHQRLICPHALGWNNRRPMLLGYQTGGHTSTGTLATNPRHRWRNFFVDEIDHVTDNIDPATTWATADNYNPAHPFNTTCEIAVVVHPTNS